MEFADPVAPKFVMSSDGLRLATYDWGGPDAPVVLAVHGFASGAILNWQRAGWVRDLARAGFRVLALDQRGHGASDKPHDPAQFTLDQLVDDVFSVIDTYLVDAVHYVGYSLGSRVGWQAAVREPERFERGVFGGIPAGDPLTTFDLDSARRFIADRTPVTNRVTDAYLTMAGDIPGNDLTSLVALVEGMRGGPQADPANPPTVPLLFATGTEDPIIDGSRMLAAAAPRGTFFEIPGRNHFNAPTSRPFRLAGVGFLLDQAARD